MKKLLFTLMTLTFCSVAYAQKGDIHINVGADVALPVGDWSEGYGIGVGATAKGLYGVSDVGQIGLTVGYIRFGLKDDYDSSLNGSLGVIPVFVVYRHHFGDLYIEPQLGFSNNKVTLKMSDSGWGDFGGSSSTTSLGYSAGLGYLMRNFDLSARYQGFSQGGTGAGFAALRVAYNFSL